MFLLVPSISVWTGIQLIVGLYVNLDAASLMVLVNVFKSMFLLFSRFTAVKEYVCIVILYLQVWTSDLAWWSNFWQLKHHNGSLTNGIIQKLPYHLVNLTGCCFHISTTFTMFVGSDFCFSVFHFVIREDSSTLLVLLE